jgi:hypothetical protein
MTRLLIVALMALPFLFWSKINTLINSGSSGAAILGMPGNLRWLVLHRVSNWVASLGLDETSLNILGFGSILYSYVMGFAFDTVLKERGLGPLLSGTLSFLGAAMAVACWISFAPETLSASMSDMMLVGGLGSALAVAISAIIKALINAAIDHFATGAKKAAQKTAKEPRLKSATARRSTGTNGF